MAAGCGRGDSELARERQRSRAYRRALQQHSPRKSLVERPHPRRRFWRIGLAVASVALALAPAAGARVTVLDGIAYGTGRVESPWPQSADLKLDLYSPAKRLKRPRPVVILVHGGGFTMGNQRDHNLVRIAKALAARGIVAASIDYRLLGAQPVLSSRVAPLAKALPDVPLATGVMAAVDDTLTASSYLRAHARKLNIDMKRLGLVGSSAGAITVDQVAYALDDHGIKGPKARFVASLWGGILVQPGASQLERGEPALFAVHGDADRSVSVALDDQLVARAHAKHVPAEYHRIPGGTHGYDGTQFFTRKVAGDETSFDRLLSFAKKRLR